jgi:hypothetical protein
MHITSHMRSQIAGKEPAHDRATDPVDKRDRKVSFGSAKASELEEAHTRLRALSRADLEVMASFETPPRVFILCMHSVQTLRGMPLSSWPDCRKLLREFPRKLSQPQPKPSDEYARSLSRMSREQKLQGDYPLPKKPERTAVWIQAMLDFRLDSLDPRHAAAVVKPWVDDPDFTPDNAGSFSRAAKAMCMWVTAADAFFKEQRRKPTQVQMERAIAAGAALIHKPSNLALQRMLPEISRQTGKRMGKKAYDELSKSKNVLMRKMFADKGHKDRARELLDDDNSGAVADKDVDIRVSYEHFRRKLLERAQAGDPKELLPTPEPTLVQLFKFHHRAFQPEVSGNDDEEEEEEDDDDDVCVCVRERVCVCKCVCGVSALSLSLFG